MTAPTTIQSVANRTAAKFLRFPGDLAVVRTDGFLLPSNSLLL